MGSQQGIAVHWKAPHVFVTSLAQTCSLCGPPGKCCGSNRRIAGQRLQHRNGGTCTVARELIPSADHWQCQELLQSSSIVSNTLAPGRLTEAQRSMSAHTDADQDSLAKRTHQRGATFLFFWQIILEKTENVSLYTIQATHFPAHTHVAHLVLIFLKYEIFNIIKTMQQNSTHEK